MNTQLPDDVVGEPTGHQISWRKLGAHVIGPSANVHEYLSWLIEQAQLINESLLAGEVAGDTILEPEAFAPRFTLEQRRDRRARAALLMASRDPKRGEAYVYRMHGIDDELLYIGSTADLGQRVLAHSQDKDWFMDVRWIQAVEFDTIDEARKYETIAILTEWPLHNIAGKQ